MSNLTRRQVLGTVAAGGAVGIAGCAGGNNGGGGGLTNAFDSVEIDGDQLVVQLAGDATSTVNVIGPGGTPSLGSKSVATGQTKVTFDLLTQYTPGEHEIVAVDSEDNQIGSTTQRLNPEVDLEKLVTYDMDPDTEWPDTAILDSQGLMTLSNSGNAPARLYYITYDNVPRWSDAAEERTKNRPGVVGFRDRDNDAITSVSPGTTVTGATGSVFGTSSVDFDCGGTSSATVVVGYQGEESFEFEIKSEQIGEGITADCKVTIPEYA
jgi:hypothetical protein